ncbi:hypothetical protein AB9F46_35805, partial [Rhizobium leguminosarum]
NVVSPEAEAEGRTLKGLGIAPTMLASVLCSYLVLGWRDPANRDYAAKLIVAFLITAILGLVVKKLGFELPETATPIAWAL